MAPINAYKNAVVVGAGVIGLTTATLLQDALPGSQVTIIAEKFLTETTSNVAAGIFLPDVSFKGPSSDVTMKWLKDSYNNYDNLLRRTPMEAHEAGIIRINGYVFSSQRTSMEMDPYLTNIVDECRPCTTEELKMFNQEFKSGIFVNTILTDCRKYLPYLMKRFQSKGGIIIKNKLSSFEELCNDYDIAFNCSGLGSRYLSGDDYIMPVRGQVFKVSAPWMKNFVYVDNDTYIIPGATGTVTLGCTRQFDTYNENVNKYDSASIWEKCTRVIPSFKHAKIEGELVGLRPYRPQVRVEKEIVTFSRGKSITIVHNYGHGGYGVMSSPGTSMYAIALGTDLATAYLKAKL